ncbi:unnamed protein product [Adineta ricciae]|uniref:Uncharacterized protein n=1 Tax=Adineta ricciae TaxID=249248 RepID=A0A815X525_ADIRI|nr:unnamed protein product [Adineta ricciae]CAF1551293.1 unnamed protein product [Adineta ricciae]
MSRTNVSNNNVNIADEVYEKVRPLQKASNNDQGHGDDIPVKSPSKFIELFSHEYQPPLQSTSLSVKSSSSNEFSLEAAMRVTDTSNEAIRTDDENGMVKSYTLPNYNSKAVLERDIILSDLSIQQQQQLTDNDCEYEIDLGNGWLTKSISSYESGSRKHKRTTIGHSADSSQLTDSLKIPFTSTFYNQHVQAKKNIEPWNGLFSSHIQRPCSRISPRTVSIFIMGTTVLVFMSVIIFLVV